ncbi:MAG: dihydrofolate reductase [Proteobacteria bacterium]|nr:dihydrofolate reductase [Pseudomonadota bacterium]
MTKIIGIMASTPNGIIGKDNALPWSYPEEIEHFRKITDSQVMVMGRKTFESAPNSLLKKTPIVFSKNKAIRNLKPCTVVESIDSFLEHILSIQCHKAFMIGGAEIAELFLKNNLISEFILTKIHKNYEGDASMDLSFFDKWQQILLTQTKDYTIYKLTNPQEIGK